MKKFTRTIENFICGNCGENVKGNGYTNHCPECLWCRHVDINPGDRAEKCGGMMEPINVEIIGGESIVNHHCLKCGFERKNKVDIKDNNDIVIELTAN